MQQVQAVGLCGWCGGNVPPVKHIRIKPDEISEILLCHPKINEGCKTEWVARVKAIAARICDVSGDLCPEIAKLVARIKTAELPSQIALLVKKLYETIQKHARELMAKLGERIYELRREFYFLAELMKYPREARYI